MTLRKRQIEERSRMTLRKRQIEERRKKRV